MIIFKIQESKALAILSAKQALRKKCPNTELFPVRIFLYSSWIQENTDQK